MREHRGVGGLRVHARGEGLAVTVARIPPGPRPARSPTTHVGPRCPSLSTVSTPSDRKSTGPARPRRARALEPRVRQALVLAHCLTQPPPPSRSARSRSGCSATPPCRHAVGVPGPVTKSGERAKCVPGSNVVGAGGDPVRPRPVRWWSVIAAATAAPPRPSQRAASVKSFGAPQMAARVTRSLQQEGIGQAGSPADSLIPPIGTVRRPAASRARAPPRCAWRRSPPACRRAAAAPAASVRAVPRRGPPGHHRLLGAVTRSSRWPGSAVLRSALGGLWFRPLRAGRPSTLASL